MKYLAMVDEGETRNRKLCWALRGVSDPRREEGGIEGMDADTADPGGMMDFRTVYMFGHTIALLKLPEYDEEGMSSRNLGGLPTNDI